MTTAATGFGTITVGADKSVSGSVTTSGVVGVAAHIHDGAPGKNGPVIVPMTKSSRTNVDDRAPRQVHGANTSVQGRKHICEPSVHSAANKGGEIRGQLKP